MLGLPVGPWALTIVSALADVVPLQSFFGQ
jgi:hypothetical protein